MFYIFARYLNELDYSGDPGLECIEKQAVWLKSMLLDCQVEHQSLGKITVSLFRLLRSMKKYIPATFSALQLRMWLEYILRMVVFYDL